jgi:hypothetical protein
MKLKETLIVCFLLTLVGFIYLLLTLFIVSPLIIGGLLNMPLLLLFLLATVPLGFGIMFWIGDKIFPYSIW